MYYISIYSNSVVEMWTWLNDVGAKCDLQRVQVKVRTQQKSPAIGMFLFQVGLV